MPRKKLEAKAIGSLPAVGGRRTDYADTVRRGLVLRVSPSGVRTWVLLYRAGGRVRRYRLGWWPETSLAAARARARAARGAVDAGRDPQADRVAERQAEELARRGGLTMGVVLERFREYVKRTASPSVIYQWPRIIDRELMPLLGRLSPADPALRARVIEAAERVHARGAHALANRVLQVARRAWRWGVQRAIIPITAPYPFLALAPLHDERPRTRYYTPAEIKALWAAMDQLERPRERDFGRLLWWTAARSIEVGTMRFDEVDHETGAWVKTATKNRQPLVLRLPRQARELVEARRAAGPGPYVLQGRTGWMKFACRQRLAANLREAVPDYRNHDVRRTVRTGLAELGVRFEVAEMVLGHVQGRIAETYNRHLYQDEIADALQRWADQLDKITG